MVHYDMKNVEYMEVMMATIKDIRVGKDSEVTFTNKIVLEINRIH